ncbi:TPA: autotransporter domain-containing protein [Cronobacter sakazakii]|nr:autotransporter domain-containing protein [Cronobacter sakazakii]HAU5516437.1 autotransporter domain-containing protein [Cronobacter sakazakii]
MSFSLSGLSLQVGLALGLACGVAAPAAAWDNLYVFGDSLSDTGNNGRYTFDSNRYPLYDEILAQKYGLTLAPSDKGGNNYAAGGGVAVPALGTDNTQEQVQRYLSQTNGRTDRDGLYIHYVGGNDLGAAVLQPLQAQSIVTGSATAAASQVRTLLNAGAGTVIVPTVPDVSATPTLIETVIQLGTAGNSAALQAAFASLGNAQTPTLAAREEAIRNAFYAAAGEVSPIPALSKALGDGLYAAYQAAAEQVSALSQLYNATEEQALVANGGGNIVRADINAIFNEILANPGQFGITNTAGMACPPGLSAADCTSSSAGFNGSQAWLFADHLHPSPQVHRLMADYIQSILTAPAQVALLNKATAAQVQNSRATLDSRYQQRRTEQAEQGSAGIFGGYSGEYARYTKNETGDGSANTNNLTIGADYRVTENWLVGALIAGSLDDQRPTDNLSYDARGYQAALFTAVDFGPGWVNADVHWLKGEYRNIQRRVELGPLTRVETGETDARLWGARLTAGLDLPVTRALTTGPVVQYAWDYSHVDGYSEAGDDSTAMRFRDQNFHSQIGSIGWRLDADIGPVKPYAQVDYKHQFGDSVWRGQGGLKSTSLTFSRDGAQDDKNWMDITAGASVALSSNVSAFAALSQTAGLSSGEQTRYNIGLSASF